MKKYKRFLSKAVLLTISASLLLSGCNGTESSTSSNSSSAFEAASSENSVSSDISSNVSPDIISSEDESSTDIIGDISSEGTDIVSREPDENPIEDNSGKNTVAEVKNLNGIPRLYINNKLSEPVFFMPNHYDFSKNMALDNEMKYASKYNVNMFIYPYALEYHDMPLFFNSTLTGVVEDMLVYNPKGKLILRLDMTGALSKWGLDRTEAAVLGGQSTDYPSMSSDAWLKAAKTALKNIVTNVMSDEFLSEHVIGFEILGGNSGEWFEYNYWDGVMDTSEPVRKGFQNYLKGKYSTDKALQEAWGNNSVSLSNVPLPEASKVPGINRETTHMANVNNGQFLLTNKDNQIYVDYLDYLNTTRSSRLCELADVVKKASQNTKLAIIYYGYHCDTPTASSGHFDLANVLKCPSIDMVSGPVSYQDRNEGGIGAHMSFVDAVTAAGKMWVDEGDYRSPAASPKPSLPYPNTLNAMNEVMERQLAKNMIFGTGVWWLDLEGSGWFNYESFWQRNQKLSNLQYNYLKIQKRKTPDICVILDESAVRIAGNAQNVGSNMLISVREQLYRSGYSYGMYLLDDVISGKLDDAKVYIFLTPWRMSSAQVDAVEKKVHKSGKTALYMYGYGMTSNADFNKLTGMNIKNTTFSGSYEVNLKLAQGLSNGIAKNSLSVNPVYYAEATNGVQSLGTYKGGAAEGKTGLALLNKNGWNSVFYGGTFVTGEMLDFLASKAGVLKYTSGGDVFHTDGQMAMIHASTDGDKTINLPSSCDIFNLETGKWLSGKSITLKNMYRGQTAILFYGRKDEINRILGR